MKLNFTTLASQLKNQQSGSQDNDISSQLNYYRKPNPHDDSNRNVKHKKSQLHKQDQSSSILIGSSILTDYFSNGHTKLSQEKSITSKINLSVMYPYEVSTSIDPDDIDSHIKQMRSKGILDESAMRFIKKQIAKDLSKSKQKAQYQNKQSSINLQSFNQSIYLQSESTKNEKTNNNNLDFLDQTQQTLITNDSLISTINPSTKHLLFKNFSKGTFPVKQNKNNAILMSTVVQSSLQKINNKLTNVNKKPNYMKPIHHHHQTTKKKAQKQLISTQAMKMQQQMKEVKSKPSLQLTKSSPFTYRIQAQRQSTYRQKKSNVFNQLYNQAYVRECMKSIQRQSIQKSIEERHNLNKTLKTEYSQQRYNVKESFMERLQKSIEKKYYKEYLINKHFVNDKTGQPYFQPDITLSKHTYEKLFHRSLQKVPAQSQKQLNEQKPSSKKSINLHNNTQLISRKSISIRNESVKNISVSYKSAARTKQNSVERLSHSVDRVDELTQKSIRVDKKSAQLVQKINQKIFNRIIKIFYPTIQKVYQQQSSQEELIDFQQTTQSLSLLSQQQWHILSPLLNQIQSLQQSTKVSSLMFKSLLQQFFYVPFIQQKQKLNYYDQLVMREIGVEKKKKIHHKGGKINSKTEKNEKQTFTMMKRERDMHRPRINDISSSMQKLNPKYDEALYYV